MCGIFGVWHRNNRPVDLEAVKYATTTLRHRGPDDEGYLLVNTQAGRIMGCGGTDTDRRLALPRIEELFAQPFNLVLGHRRLAILDLSPAGHQPMAGSDGMLWIVYNGEIYNYLELRDELKAYGHGFQTETDTEVILAAYKQWGPACLARFNGMWAFALYDEREQRLFCARDRFGIKPFHYVFKDGTFAFASEIKALLGMGIGKRAADPAAVFDYLVWGLVNHSQRTFFAGISALLPGHYLLVQEEKISIHRYWELDRAVEDDRVTDCNDLELAERFRELLTDAIRLRLRSDVPIGTCLSGGLDSSSIVCLANRLMFCDKQPPSHIMGARQKTFTAAFDDPSIDERRYVEVVVRATGAEPHYTFPRPEHLLELLPRLLRHQEEPFGSTSIYAQWQVMALAKQHGITVLLDGQGADELLAGYPFAWDVYLGDLFRSGRWLTLWREVDHYQGRGQVGEAGRLAGLRRALFSAIPRPVKDGVRELQGERWPSWLNPDFVKIHKETRTWPYRADGTLRTFLMDQMRYHLPSLLRFEDRNSMAFSLEARVPFLDYRLARFTLALEDQQRISRGVSKTILRRAMKRVVPEAILARRDKIAFATPEGAWLQGPLWLHVKEILLSESFRNLPFFNHAKLRSLLEHYQQGQVQSTSMLWSWLNLTLWVREFSTTY
jgi:asparagine synthase (glutamine-hydrolysing)